MQGNCLMNNEITLRDYFAAKALPLAIEKFANWTFTDKTREQAISEYCYKVADAMLLARGIDE